MSNSIRYKGFFSRHIRPEPKCYFYYSLLLFGQFIYEFFANKTSDYSQSQHITFLLLCLHLVLR